MFIYKYLVKLLSLQYKMKILDYSTPIWKLQVYAKDFAVLYAYNTTVPDDDLFSAGTMGILRRKKNSASEFDLIKAVSGAIDYTFDSMLTNIIYMYGDIMVLSQHLPGTTRGDIMLHCKFVNDVMCQEFQQQLNPTSLQDGEVSRYTCVMLITPYFP